MNTITESAVCHRIKLDSRLISSVRQVFTCYTQVLWEHPVAQSGTDSNTYLLGAVVFVVQTLLIARSTEISRL